MPDVNLLVYAHRADEKSHAAHRRWLEDVMNGPQPFALSVLVAVGFIRIVTNPRIYAAPTPPQVAIAAIEEIRAQPQCRVVVPGPDHLERVLELCRLVSEPGNSSRTHSTRRLQLQKAARGLSATVTSPDSRHTAWLGIISSYNRRHPRRSPSNSYIGIGRSLAAPPSHTTVHTGPYMAVRQIKCLRPAPMREGQAHGRKHWARLAGRRGSG